MNKIVIIILIFIGLCCVYLLLGSFGLLPNWFYNQCKDIDKDTAIKRGCCEDRDMGSPVSWIFGKDNCSKYENFIQEKEDE